jgi:ATP-binding cassette, subfamily B, bacterial HlyB/CyaB
MEAIVDSSNLSPGEQDLIPRPGGDLAVKIRLMAIAAAARFHGAELDQADLRGGQEEARSPAVLAQWVRSAGL